MPKVIYRWQDDDVTKLKSLAQKYPTATIARQLSRSAASIIAKAQQLKISLKIARPRIDIGSGRSDPSD
jgi:hypothetical protein